MVIPFPFLMTGSGTQYECCPVRAIPMVTIIDAENANDSGWEDLDSMTLRWGGGLSSTEHKQGNIVV